MGKTPKYGGNLWLDNIKGRAKNVLKSKLIYYTSVGCETCVMLVNGV